MPRICSLVSILLYMTMLNAELKSSNSIFQYVPGCSSTVPMASSVDLLVQAALTWLRTSFSKHFIAVGKLLVWSNAANRCFVWCGNDERCCRFLHIWWLNSSADHFNGVVQVWLILIIYFMCCWQLLIQFLANSFQSPDTDGHCVLMCQKIKNSLFVKLLYAPHYGEVNCSSNF